jgi:cyclophilin family peptidyl-prolyl cis-trans isomerase
LPIKFTKKRIGSGNEFDVAQIPIFGSYRDGFYDPLTARPRRLPLEIIRVEAKTGVPNLAYSLGLTNLVGQATLEPTSQSKPLLSFTIPGIVAMNHLDRANDGASSEFFALQQMSMQDDRRHLLDGEYAPFGFITEGFNLFQTIQPNDIIDETFVDEWGQLSLVKLRQSSFSEAAKGPESEKEQI